MNIIEQLEECMAKTNGEGFWFLNAHWKIEIESNGLGSNYNNFILNLTPENSSYPNAVTIYIYKPSYGKYVKISMLTTFDELVNTSFELSFKFDAHLNKFEIEKPIMEKLTKVLSPFITVSKVFDIR